MEELKVLDSSETVQEDTKEEKKWCVYIHTNLINGKKYIGITSQKPEVRWNYGYGYKKCPLFWNAICKYGWDNFEHEIVFDGLDYESACQKEKDLIFEYKSNNNKYGYNLTLGGEATFGWIPTEETRQNISVALKGKFAGENNPNYGNHKLAGENNPMYGVHRYGKDSPMFGKKMSDSAKKKISESNKGKIAGKKHYLFGKHLPNSIKQKISISNGIPVYSIELDELFISSTFAANKYNFCQSDITKCCKGKKNTCGKHPNNKELLHWKYVYDQVQNDGSTIYGAITLGYITQQQVNDYLNNLKEGE